MQKIYNEFFTLKKCLHKLRSMHVETTKNKHSIENDDIDIILKNEWFNDKIINFYMEIICEYFEHEAYAFSTHFFNQFKINDLKTILSWYKEIDFFNFKYLIFPINESLHWTLIIFNIQTNVVEFFDSMPGSIINEKYVRLVQHFIFSYCKENNQQYEHSKIKKANGFKQNNGLDCGLYVCLNARHRIESEYFLQKEIDGMKYRYKLLHEIFARRILYPINHKFVN